MDLLIRNDVPTFRHFFQTWLTEQNQLLSELNGATNLHPNNSDPNPSELTRSADDQVLRRLITKLIQHYQIYYQVKASYAKHDVLTVLYPPWMSSVELNFFWIGGWRPTTAIHLLYSKSGLQFEARFNELIHGVKTFDLGDISPRQFQRVDKLHKKTIEDELRINEKMAKHQETLADSLTVRLSNMVTKSMRGEGEPRCDHFVEEQTKSNLESKEERLNMILSAADDLRFATFQSVVEILTPIQAVHFLIAAAELQLRVHDWGKKRDADLGHRHDSDEMN